MNPEDTYRQVTLPGPRGDDRGGRGGRDDKLPSWSARRTALTVALRLVGVVGVFWWAALEQQEKWEIREVRPVEISDGTRTFSLRDLDGHWWEIYHRPGHLYDDLFEREAAHAGA